MVVMVTQAVDISQPQGKQQDAAESSDSEGEGCQDEEQEKLVSVYLKNENHTEQTKSNK